MTYSIEVRSSVLKALKKLSREDQITIARAIRALASNPRPRNCLKLSGSAYYRIRVGYHRIIYEIQDQRLFIVVLKIGQRKEVYRKR